MNRARKTTIHHRLKDVFVPHAGNHHHPHVLRHRTLFGFSLFLLICKAALVAVAVGLPQATVRAEAITPARIFEYANQARAAQGLPALNWSDQLAAAAQAKGQDMLSKYYFAHVSPAGLSSRFWIWQAGYRFSRSGENLAVHYTTAEDVQGAWMASPEHRQNILNANFEDSGVAVLSGKFEGVDTLLVVQLFGLAAPTAAPDNEPVAVSNSDQRVPEIAQLTPTKQGIKIALKSPPTVQVSVSLGADRQPLTPAPNTGTWTGILPTDSSTETETVYAQTRDQDGQTSTTPLVLALSGSTPEGLFLGSPTTADRLPWLKTIFSVLALTLLALLSGSLLIYGLSVHRVKKIPAVSHALVVIFLAVILTAI